ncbi:MAG: BatA and WFA domain-containing protein [Gemmatimonadetes bacterium]|nr:BatA and WFA domain-containing protein [Gemmatimonadota bacterium]
MSLALLVPLFLLGVAGVVVPIVLHLTRRQRRNLVHFPSLMFLERIPYQEQRRRRIHYWFLLSLRALALALVAVAFARPFFEQDTVGVGASSGPREVVVLIDQSYSMEIGDQFDRARDEARRIFNELGPLDRASLVMFGRGARVVARSTADRSQLSRALDTIQVSSSITRFGPALKVAQTILEESELPNGEVFLLTDFQRNGWTGDEGIRLPPGSKVTPVQLGEKTLDNIQVTDVALAREAVSGRERVTPTARLARRGGEQAREVMVSLEVDGQELQSRSVTIPPNGSATVTFQPFTLSQPHTRGSVRVPGDELPADDARHFVVSPGTALSMLIVEGGSAASDASLYLRRALAISEGRRFDVAFRRSDTVRPQDLEGTDGVIINDANVDGGSAERLRRFVEAGGGLLLVLGQSSGWPNSAADMLPGTIGQVQDRQQGRGGRLGFLEYGHPIFEAFSGPRSGDFTGARFFRARDFTPADSATVLARFDDGSVALAELRYGRGTVLVWTSALDNFWNDLALQPVYLPFVHRISEYVGGRTEPLPWFVAGQVVDLADPEALEMAGLVSAEAAGLVAGLDQVAVTPSGQSVRLPAGDGPRYLLLDEHGFYTVRAPGSDPDRPFVIAVNVELEESNLARIDAEELVAQVGTAAAGPDGGPDFEQATEMRMEDLERRQSLWRWILIAAFSLFVSETLLSNWVSRKAGVPGVATG